MDIAQRDSIGKRRPGRPVGSTKSAIAAAKVKATGGSPTLAAAYSSFVARHPSSEPGGDSLDLVLRRIDERTANVIDNKTLPQRIADLTGMSLLLASKVVMGVTPLTLKMAVVIADKLGVSLDFLLTGVDKHVATPSICGCSLTPDETGFLQSYRLANDIGKAAIQFHLFLPRLLETLPEDASARVMGSLMRLHDAGEQELLSYLPEVLGRYKARTGLDPLSFYDAPPVFTPIHENMGIFGPEQLPLVGYLR